MTNTATKPAATGFQDLVVESLHQTHETITQGTQWYAELAKPYLSGLTTGPFPNQFAGIFDIWDTTLEATSRMIDIQRGLANALRDMLTTTDDNPPPTPPKTPIKTSA